MSLRLPDPMSLPLTVSERREAGAKGCLLCSPGPRPAWASVCGGKGRSITRWVATGAALRLSPPVGTVTWKMARLLLVI